MAKYRLNTVANNYLRVCTRRILALMDEHNLALTDIYQAAGIGQSVHVFPISIVTFEHYKRLLCYLDESGLIPGIGLVVGGRTQLADLGVLGYASQSSKTFWDALHIGVPYAALLGWEVRVDHRKLDPNWTELQIHSTTTTPLAKAVHEQWAMLCLTGVERLMTITDQLDFSDLHFYFPFPDPPYRELYSHYFNGCHLHFDSGFCGWRYPRYWDDIELPGHDEAMSGFCTQQLALITQCSRGDLNIVDKVRAYIYFTSGDGFPDMSLAAANFNMSAATLRRRLKAYDVTYEALVENIRKEMAVYLMTESDLRSEEIAYKLGYSSPSNFYTAFKNWFGCSTSEYRRGGCPEDLAKD